MAELIRTPDERFEDLEGFPFSPNYLDGLPSLPAARIHYVDEGSRDSKSIFLCLHGEPTWSYLYRKMIPIFVGSGHRVIAPDLIGFGRSDKLVDKRAYSFQLHRNILLEFIERLDLFDITLVCQDWGGVLRLTLPMEAPARFKRLLVMNTALTTGNLPFNLPFLLWRSWARLNSDLNVGRVMKFAEPRLTLGEVRAYDAPFPEKRFKAGVHTFPSLVPIRGRDPGADVSRKAKDWWQKEWTGEAFMAIGKNDPVLGPKVMKPLQKIIRNCADPFYVEAGHFVQERGEDVAGKALEYFRLNSRLR